MGDTKSDRQKSIDHVSAAEEQPGEAELVEPTEPWGNGSAPSIPSVDIDNDHVSWLPPRVIFILTITRQSDFDSAVGGLSIVFVPCKSVAEVLVADPVR